MKTERTATAAPETLDWSGERRLFLGILPDTANAMQLAALLPQIATPAKPVAVSNLHLTLLFLGQSTALQARQLTEALAVLPLPAFSVQLDEWQVWPGPAVLCLAGDVVDPALAALDAKLLAIAAACGFAPPQHSLKPHITLARHCKTMPDLPSLQIRLHATRLQLFHSASTPEGVCYRPLWQSLLVVT